MRPCELSAVSCCWIVVTAADRAAATSTQDYTMGPKGWRGRSESCQTGSGPRLAPAGAKRPAAAPLKRLPPQRELSCAVTRMTENTSHTRTVAAALSAAVTTAKLIGDTPTLQAEPSQKKRPNSNASRSSGERGLGGEALLSEKRPRPPETSSHLSPKYNRKTKKGGDAGGGAWYSMTNLIRNR